MNTLKFDIPSTEKTISLSNYTLIIAGFTGSNTEKVKEHLDELQKQGITIPDEVPTFYRIPSENATQSEEISVVGTETSGEIEPVLLVKGGSYFISLGSDHTDREIEMKNIARSKASCQKPISRTAVPLEELALAWDHLELSSEVSESGKWVPYQIGKCLDLTHPLKLAGLLQKSLGRVPANAVIFLGTIPIIGGKFRFSEEFRGTLTNPESNLKLSVHYRVRREQQ